jgi:hypothetical protein
VLICGSLALLCCSYLTSLQWLFKTRCTSSKPVRYVWPGKYMWLTASPLYPSAIRGSESETLHRTCRTFFFLPCDPTRVMAFSFLRFLDHTQWRTTVGRTPLDEWSVRRSRTCYSNKKRTGYRINVYIVMDTTILRICHRSVLYQFLRISLTLPPLVNVTLTCHSPYMAAVLNLVSLGLHTYQGVRELGWVQNYSFIFINFNSNLAFHSVINVDFLDSRNVC